jgi:uncharacterized protein DUF4136
MKRNNKMTTMVLLTRTIRSITIISLILIVVMVFTNSCAPSVTLSADYDRSINFSSYKTFAMYELKASDNVNQLNQARIEKYIRMEMGKRGYVESKDHPDLKVNAVTVLKNRRGISASTSYYGFGGFYRPYAAWAVPVSGYTSVRTYDYKDGSLVIDVIDAKVNKMIWTGSAVAELYSTPKNPEEAISSTIAKIMAGYPVGISNTQTAKN